MSDKVNAVHEALQNLENGNVFAFKSAVRGMRKLTLMKMLAVVEYAERGENIAYVKKMIMQALEK